MQMPPAAILTLRIKPRQSLGADNCELSLSLLYCAPEGCPTFNSRPDYEVPDREVAAAGVPYIQPRDLFDFPECLDS